MFNLLFIALLVVIGIGEYASPNREVDKGTFTVIWVLCLILAIDRMVIAS